VRVSIERETFPALVESRSLYALSSDAYWIDAGTPDAYLRAHRDLLGGRRPGSPSPGAELDPSIGSGVWRIGTVQAAGRVERSLLGTGASVADGAVVEDSVVGAGAIVEEGAVVTGSVLLPGARIASAATVEGSVIGPGAIVGQRCNVHALSVVGAGAVTASGTVVDGERVPAGV
jgi:mannose-1-phosphate guanylyltransferase